MSERRYISWAELKAAGRAPCGSRVGVMNAVARGDFPAPFKLSAGRVGWLDTPADDPASVSFWEANRPVSAAAQRAIARHNSPPSPDDLRREREAIDARRARAHAAN